MPRKSIFRSFLSFLLVFTMVFTMGVAVFASDDDAAEFDFDLPDSFTVNDVIIRSASGEELSIRNGYPQVFFATEDAGEDIAEGVAHTLYLNNQSYTPELDTAKGTVTFICKGPMVFLLPYDAILGRSEDYTYYILAVDTEDGTALRTYLSQIINKTTDGPMVEGETSYLADGISTVIVPLEALQTCEVEDRFRLTVTMELKSKATIVTSTPFEIGTEREYREQQEAAARAVGGYISYTPRYEDTVNAPVVTPVGCSSAVLGKDNSGKAVATYRTARDAATADTAPVSGTTGGGTHYSGGTGSGTTTGTGTGTSGQKTTDGGFLSDLFSGKDKGKTDSGKTSNWGIGVKIVGSTGQVGWDYTDGEQTSTYEIGKNEDPHFEFHIGNQNISLPFLSTFFGKFKG